MSCWFGDFDSDCNCCPKLFFVFLFSVCDTARGEMQCAHRRNEPINLSPMTTENENAPEDTTLLKVHK